MISRIMGEVYRTQPALRCYSKHTPHGEEKMLDVHAPEHRISGTRDFAIHLLTITVGLLIALGLENAAEALHHRHQRKEAEQSIREELERNRTKLKQGAPVVMQDRQVLRHAIDVMQALQQKRKMEDKHLNFEYSTETLDDGAWRTASSTGVLAYLDYDEVERLSDAYKEQAQLEAAEDKALQDYLELTPGLKSSGDISPEEAKEIQPLLRKALADVTGVLAYGEGTLGAYDKALQ